MNIGIVGVGDISQVYVNMLKKYPEIVSLKACAAGHYENALKKAEEYGIQKAYPTAEELIDDPEIDAILNLTVPEVHAKYNLLALEKGKHVYSEKPLATTFEDGKKIIQLAREKKVRVGCAPDTFLGGRLQKCQELIDQGVIGELIGGTAFFICRGNEWLSPDPYWRYQPGAGPVWDNGPYFFRMFSVLYGPVRRCMAMSKITFPEREILLGEKAGEKVPVNVDTYTSALLEFENGAIVNCLFTFDVWESELPKAEIYGSKGTITLPDLDAYDGPNIFGGEIWLRNKDNYRWTELPRKKESLMRETQKIEIDRPFISVSHADNARGIGLIDMCMAIREGRSHRASGDMALHELELMEKLSVSAAEGRAVEMTTTFRRPALTVKGEWI